MGEKTLSVQEHRSIINDLYKIYDEIWRLTRKWQSLGQDMEDAEFIPLEDDYVDALDDIVHAAESMGD